MTYTLKKKVMSTATIVYGGDTRTNPRRRRGENNGFDEATIFQIRNLQIAETVRLFVLQIEAFVSFILEIFSAIAMFATRLFALLSPYLFLFILFVFFFWMVHIWWPFFIKLTIDVLIPVLDLCIIAFNIIFKITVFIYMIVASVWNAFVPFLGMLLYFVFDIILTVMDLVNQILGAIDLTSLFNSLMEILNVVMEIVLQIIEAIIKVGESVLQTLAKVISVLIEIVMSVVKILLPIVVFLFKVVYFVLEPIIKLIQFFFGGGQSNTYGNGSSKKLLSLNIMGNTYRDDYYSTAYDPYAEFVMSTLSMNPADLYTTIHKNSTPADDLWSSPEMTGRRPLAYKQRKAGLEFLDEVEDTEEDMPRSVNDDDITYGFAHTFHRSAKQIPTQVVHETFSVMDQIMDHHRNRDPLTISAILTNYNKQYGHLRAPDEDRLGSVRYASQLEHPNDMKTRLEMERANKRAEIMAGSNAGRKLLDIMAYPDKANEHLNHYMSALEKEHALLIMDQAVKYKNKHDERMMFATVFTSAVSTTMKKHAETTFHPDNIMEQWTVLLNQMGFEDVWDWHRQFIETHGDAVNFILYISSIFQHPFFDIIKKTEEADPNSPYFHDWVAEQEKMNSGRKLFSVNDDNKAGNTQGITRASFSGFAVVSKKNCKSAPKHPLCAPIPSTKLLSWSIPTLILTQKQKEQISQNVGDCTPWIDEVFCFICIERVYNTLVEILFLIVAIGPVNNAIASLILIAPWTGFFLNWMFIVPKFKRATTFQWVCFVYELWNPFIVFLIIFSLYYFFWPIIQAFYRAFRGVTSIRARPPKPNEDVAALDRLFAPIIDDPASTPPPGLTPMNVLNQTINSKITNNHHYHSADDRAYLHLLNRVERYAEATERIQDRYHLLIARLAHQHYSLHVRHPDRIDDEAANHELRYLTQHHPVLRLPFIN